MAHLLRHDLRGSFAELLGVAPDQLQNLHERFSSDCGKKQRLREKLQLLAPLADAARRENFVATYLRFVTECIAPAVADEVGCDRVAFQAFPCVRVNRPGASITLVH